MSLKIIFMLINNYVLFYLYYTMNVQLGTFECITKSMLIVLIGKLVIEEVLMKYKRT